MKPHEAHRELGAAGLPSKEHYHLASKVLGREVISFTELTELELQKVVAEVKSSNITITLDEQTLLWLRAAEQATDEETPVAVNVLIERIRKLVKTQNRGAA